MERMWTDIKILLRNIFMDRINMDKRKFLRWIVIAVAAGMIGYGVYRGEVSIVLNKAINICMECIGLG